MFSFTLRFCGAGVLALGLLLVGGGHAFGQVPQQIGYQGVLTDVNGNLVSTSVPMTFKIYDAADVSGTLLWSEDQPANVAVVNGVFSVVLGVTTPLTASLFLAGANRWLTLKIDQDDEMLPRQQILSVPYALRAGTCDSLGTYLATDFTTPAQVTQSIDQTLTSYTYAKVKLNDNGAGNIANNVLNTSAAAGPAAATLYWGDQQVWTSASGKPANVVTSVGATANGGLTANNTAPAVPTVGLTGLSTAACSAGQLLKWDGAKWYCASPYSGIFGSAGFTWADALYVVPFKSTTTATETQAQIPVPVTCNMDNIRAYSNNIPATGPYKITVEKNAAATALTCTIAGGTKTCSGSGAILYNAGDLLSFAMSCTANCGTNIGGFSVTCTAP